MQPRCNREAATLAWGCVGIGHGHRTMTDRAGDVLRTFPPRPLNPDERALVDTWLAATCNVASAYVSERRSDDPALYRRIVVTIGPEPGHPTWSTPRRA